jgi:hypothetical protein
MELRKVIRTTSIFEIHPETSTISIKPLKDFSNPSCVQAF